MVISMLGMMFLVVVGALVVVGLVVRQGPSLPWAQSRARLPSASAADQDRRLAEQAEQIELLQDELQRLKDQADFTEKLLTERGSPQPGDALEEDTPD